MENKTEPIGEGITYSVGWHQHQLLEELIAEHMLFTSDMWRTPPFRYNIDKICRAGETVFIQRNHLIDAAAGPSPEALHMRSLYLFSIRNYYRTI